jgi:hypothetical protein
MPGISMLSGDDDGGTIGDGIVCLFKCTGVLVLSRSLISASLADLDEDGVVDEDKDAKKSESLAE